MWLLESSGDVWQGRRLWLRPGKRYLFGRTEAEIGQLVISDKTISRKHLTITVDPVEDGAGRDRKSRSKITIEDLDTKIGTVVNGVHIKGQQHTVETDVTEITMGRYAKSFRLFWHPVVFSFSVSTREEQAGIWEALQEQLEQLDIKYTPDYDIARTTHVITKKRNTSKGLQALINGRYIVLESFIHAIVQGATPEGEGLSSPLEGDFDGKWPNALDHLPPRGEELTSEPGERYAPDPRRVEIFDGYTVVFYQKSQFDTLFPVIANGKGKAVLKEVTPGETTLDEFIHFVKDVAGEKGVGEFEDGSEGKGVLIVKYIPNPEKGTKVDWWKEFATVVALRLDQRLVDQKEFLDIILAVEPARLRRQLEVESTPAAQEQPRRRVPSAMEVDTPEAEEAATRPAPRSRRARTQRLGTSRFKGFDADVDDDEIEELAAQTQAEEAAAAARTQQEENIRSQLKRSAPGDIMDEIAPNAKAVKRRRIEAGEEAIPSPSPEVANAEDEEVMPESPQNAIATQKSKAGKSQTGRKKKPDDPILDQATELARQRREVAEKEKAEANAFEGDIDFADLRRLTLIETVSVRPPPVSRTREQDIADGKWDSRWNGLQNFKKFKRRGHTAGRPVQKVILGLKATKTKEYGLSDDYWLEGSQRTRQDSLRQDASASASVRVVDESLRSSSGRGRVRNVVVSESDSSDFEQEEEEQEMSIEQELPRTKAGMRAEKANSQRRGTQSTGTTGTQSQSQSQSQSYSLRGKRAAAAAPPAMAPPAKRSRVANSDDDSDDELKFKFGRKR